MRTATRRDMLLGAAALAAGAFAAPGPALSVQASPEPQSWPDPVMPGVTHRRIETNGIRLHVAEQGEGPLVLLCHGFPECWYSWRHQLPALAKAGFRAVAPDLRGYGRSDQPQGNEKYTLLDDIGDVVGLVDALDGGPAVIAGHDIGATIAWQAALIHPDRFRAVIALSVPFRRQAFGTTVPPTTLMPKTEDAVFYQLFLQTPEAEVALGRNLRRTFRSQFYALSGHRPPLAPGGFPGGMIPRGSPSLIDPPFLPAWVRDADIDVYVEAFARSGFHGPLAWYRNVDVSWAQAAPTADAKVTVPALYMAGDHDFVAQVYSRFIPEQADMVPGLRTPIMLAGCGHWTQQERAPQVSAAMADFLRSV
ncbi:MAG TPA: alpha/beta hydrolase [Rhizomicrobium sp.]|nr:alpha/beta hydrolase [Rhizomicrobium sp.]